MIALLNYCEKSCSTLIMKNLKGHGHILEKSRNFKSFKEYEP